ncbi:MAG: preprotein translocase subunit YajC [Alphaproteobacteria bacterium]|nr:preprotein translocase subunit YajC [Alphaproteobacteria bacterium]
MFDLTHLFVGAAWAADAAADVQQSPDAAGTLMRFLPLFLIFGVFYFLLIRPQQKKQEEHNTLIKALKKGDKVITGGGIVGTVTSLAGDDYAMVEIAQGVQVKVARSSISGYLAEPDKSRPATNDDKKK